MTEAGLKAMLATVTDAPARAVGRAPAGTSRAAVAAGSDGGPRSLRAIVARVMTVARPRVDPVQVAVQAVRSISATRKASSSDCTRLSRGSQTDS